MKANTNPTTGIPYGIIRADYIDPDLFNDLCYAHGNDVNYDSALEDHLAQKRREFDAAEDELRIKRAETGEDREHNPHLGDDDPEFDEDYERDQFAESYQCDEPVYEGEHEGVQYRTTWIGGAPHLYVFKSPVLTKCRPCSPCVPNAGNLEQPGDYEAYGVPVTWLTENFINEFVHDSGCAVILNMGKFIHSPDHSLQQISKASFDTVELANEDCFKMRLQRRL